LHLNFSIERAPVVNYLFIAFILHLHLSIERALVVYYLLINYSKSAITNCHESIKTRKPRGVAVHGQWVGYFFIRVYLHCCLFAFFRSISYFDPWCLHVWHILALSLARYVECATPTIYKRSCFYFDATWYNKLLRIWARSTMVMVLDLDMKWCVGCMVEENEADKYYSMIYIVWVLKRHVFREEAVDRLTVGQFFFLL
jgi:hypothetical protein